VDHAVKVDFRPRGEKKSTAGVFSKAAVSTHSFVTTVKNLRKQPVSLALADTLPRSADGRIKVVLVRPDPSDVLDASADSAAATSAGEEDGGDCVKQNPATNNLVWFRTIAVGGSVEIPFEYRVEFPAGETITVA
jgi:hypothetical protein